MIELDTLDTVICLFAFWAGVLSLGNDILKIAKLRQSCDTYCMQKKMQMITFVCIDAIDNF